MRNLIIITFLATLISAQADDFYLTDSQGREYGPFEFAVGKDISISTTKLTITKIITPETSKTEKKMRSIIIPEIEFRNAHINDVIQFLVHSSRDYDKDKDRKSIGICIMPAPTLTTQNKHKKQNKQKGDPFASISTPSTHVNTGITFAMKNVSLYKALATICKVAELSFSIDENGIVWIEEKKVE